jgi:hypothetical protein
MDVNTDLLYGLVEKFYNRTLFYLSIFFYVLPNFAFIVQLRNVRPYVMSPLFLKFLKDNFIWLGVTEWRPTYHNEPLLNCIPNHDNIFFVLAYILKWIVFVILQILSIIVMILLIILSIPCQIYWFLLGLILFQSKSIAINSIWNKWFYIYSGDVNIEQKEDGEIDLSFLHRSKLLEFVLESGPQLVIQTINNLKINSFNLLELNSVAIFSSSFSLLMIFNGIYKYLYHVGLKNQILKMFQLL